VLDETETELLKEYSGNIIFEGSELAFDHLNDTSVDGLLHSRFARDLFLNETTPCITLGNHEITAGVASLCINSSFSPYPDGVELIDGIGIGTWPEGDYAIVAYNDSNSKIVYFTFSLDAITDEKTQEDLIINSVAWASPPKPPSDPT